MAVITRVGQLLVDRARDSSGRPSVAVGRRDTVRTWRELGEAASAWSARLRACVPSGSRVGIQLGDPLDFVSLYLAGLSAAMVVVPLSTELSRYEQAAKIDGFGVDLLVTDIADLDLDAVRSDVRPVVEADGLLIARVVTGKSRQAGSAGGGGVLLSTSGTTGAAKGVLLDERQLLHTATAIASHHGITDCDVGYCPLPLAHVNAQVVGLLTALVSGASLVVDAGFHRDHWDVVAAHGATWVNSVPAILGILANLPAPDDDVRSRVRFARSASAPLPVAVLQDFEQHTGIGVLETYGMTEAASQITANPVEPSRRKPGSVGQPVGVEVRILDDAGRDCRPDAEGMVEIRGSSIVDSYELAGGGRLAAVGADGWLRTGDVGRRDPDGFVFLAGRCDDVINRGGQKLHPRDVEEVLMRHPGVAEVIVVGRPHVTLGEEPVAFVRLEEGQDGERVCCELDELAVRELARYRRPVATLVVDAFEKGATGKTRRSGLRVAAAQTAVETA